MSAPDPTGKPTTLTKESVEALRAEMARAYPALVSPGTAVQVNPFAQLQQGGFTALPVVAGAQSFNAQQLTQTVPDIYIGGNRRI